MNLFRSEEHVARWLGSRPPGVTIAVTTLSELAHAWWDDRVSPQWTPRAREHNQAVLARLGLVGPFWTLG